MSKTCAYSLAAFAAFTGAAAAAEDTITASRELRNSVPSIRLGVAGNFAVLSATGLTNVPPSVIVGDVGASPITGASILIECPEVIGNIYTVDAAGPACQTTSASMLTTAIGDMGFAYSAAAGVSNPDYLDLGTGLLGGMTLGPGVYKFGSDVLLASDIYLEGTESSYDKWIFQIDGKLNVATGVAVHLSKGAEVQNIVWQVADDVSFLAGAHFEGIVLAKTLIAMVTGATMNGRLLAQTAVTLQSNTIVQPQLLF